MFLVHSCFQTEISVRWLYAVLGTLFTLKTNLKIRCSFLYRWRNRSSKEARAFQKEGYCLAMILTTISPNSPNTQLREILKNCSSENQRMTALKENLASFLSLLLIPDPSFLLFLKTVFLKPFLHKQ